MAKNRRILIIDDSPAIHQDFRKILSLPSRAAPGLLDDDSVLFGDTRPAVSEDSYEIDSALQGRDALEMVTRASRSGRPYALTFTDMRMPPGWDGVETIERILKEMPSIELCICSAYSDYSWHDVIRRLARPGIRLLRKPFETHEVLAVAAELTDKWSQRNPQLPLHEAGIDQAGVDQAGVDQAGVDQAGLQGAWAMRAALDLGPRRRIVTPVY